MRACCGRSPTRRSTSTISVRIRGHPIHSTRVHGPRPAGAVRRRDHLSARRDPCGGQGRPAETDPGLPGKPQPDLRHLSRSRPTRLRRSWSQRFVGVAPLEATDHLGVVHRLWPVTDVKVDRRSCGRHGAKADLRRRRPSPLRDGLQLPRPTAAARAARPDGSRQFRADDVRQHERSRHDRVAHPSTVPWPAAIDLG